tara:strand:- start:313 stop:786 length:474 start_codon:yes stop_codon:yes gene_type:complete
MTDYAIGSDGNVSLPTGFNARLRAWSCSIGRATTDISAFGSAGKNRRASSVVDITGSASGIPQFWDGNDTGSATAFSPIPLASDAETGALDDVATLAANPSTSDVITLTVAANTTIAFNAVFSNYGFSVAQNGDNTVTFNFEMNDGNGPTVTWDETA